MKTLLLFFVLFVTLLDIVLLYRDFDDDYDDYQEDYQERWVPLRKRYGGRGGGQGGGRSGGGRYGGQRGYGRGMAQPAYYASAGEAADEQVCNGDPFCENRIRNYAAEEEEAVAVQPRAKAQADAEKEKRHRSYENALKEGEERGKEDLEASGGPEPYGGYLLKMTLSDDI